MEEEDKVKSDQVDEHRRAQNRNTRKGSLSNRKGRKKRKPESQGRSSTKLTSVTPFCELACYEAWMWQERDVMVPDSSQHTKE
jgi:hypothetical protein